MPPGIVAVATISSASSSSSCPLQDCTSLASCADIPIRMQNALASDSVFILHRTQWQCLAKSYSEVLQTLTHLLLQHACLSTALLGPAKQPIVDLLQVALLRAMQNGERCMEGCTAGGSSFSHSWLLDKALKLGDSTDVVDVHLHNFLWAFSAFLIQGNPQSDTLESDLVQLTRALSDIWACQDSEADLSEACSFLNTVKVEYKLEGETRLLADFILHKVLHAQESKSVGCVDVLPTYLWIDPGSLTKEPEILGEGAYGKVQEARWLGGRFAVKDFFYVENNIAFGSEAAIQARLRHPNVVSLVCCTRNLSLHKCSLVLELMHQDLRVFMIERKSAGMDPPFSLSVAMDLMLQIAQGMEYLHSLHIMHRDLKSSNILVSFPTRSHHDVVNMNNNACPCAHLKIADFGMSKAKLASSKYTTRQVGATPWRAPEVFEMNPEDEVEGDMNGKYTKKADVYSFGLVCYEILTGKCPFEGTQVRRRVLGGERPLLPSFCPPALSSYIERCWHAEPSRRPPFIQICKMLRFFKACMYRMNDYDQQSPAGWLLHPLSLDVCMLIDRMSRSLVQSLDAPPHPQPVTIPLEMHCCRVVLAERDETESPSNEHGNNVTSITITQEVAESSISTHKPQQSGCGHGKSSSKAKSFIYVPRFVRKLFSTRSAQLAKSELQDALGLVRDFTYEELRLATADFSKLVGEGGRGKVYCGKLHDGRAIAVKVFIRPQILRGGHLVSSETGGFLQELRIASQLRHRNIVTLLGWCQDRGKLLLVYEFMPKGNVASHIFGKRKCLNWQRRYKVIYQLASALKYLHHDSSHSQIVHRDVKAANVLLDSEWNARLGDCGLAVLLRNGDAPVQRLAGTFGFIAPECVAQGLVSPALDVYAFGVTVLEIVTGRKAYTSDEMGETQFVRDWVGELYQHGDLMEAADARLGGKFEEVEMQRLLRLGVLCTSAEPQIRPHIKKVLRILSEQPCPGAETPSLGTGFLMADSAACSSSSTGIFWSRPMTEHLSLDGKEDSGPSTPRIKDEAPQLASVQAFTFKELERATGHFSPSNILGEGGFGAVFKGAIHQIKPAGPKSNPRITVAVKMLNSEGLQGHKEWLTEVCFLGTLHHPHLVKLIGFCCENTHRLLVYEYIPNGSLDGHLFRKATKPTLQWATRMKIALSAAKGLAFLHGAEKPIISRDFKASNILLDSDYTAKLSDFGLAKYGPSGEKTHVSTRVMGTYGYAAPEYIATGHLTSRSDVYSFGVLLLELLTGQRCIDKTRGKGKERLVDWVYQHKRELSRVIDPCLEGCYSAKGAQKAVTLALHCVNPDSKARPTMSDAVEKLEALQE